MPSSSVPAHQNHQTDPYDDRLAHSQAQVRSALQDLYGTLSNVHVDNRQNVDTKKKQEEYTPQLQPHQRSTSIRNDDQEDPTLSLGGPINVGKDQETFLFETNTPDNGPAVLLSNVQTVMNGNARQTNHQVLSDSDHDDSLVDCTSMSSFSLSELCSQSSVGGGGGPGGGALGGEFKSSSFSKPPSGGLWTNPAAIGNNDEHMQMTNDTVQDLRRELKSLEKEKYDLQEEVDLLRADRQLLSPRKYQVELDSMRLVAEQIQKESEEKIQVLQHEKNILSDEMERLQNQYIQMQQRNNGEIKDACDDVWKKLVHRVLEQICLLEESGLRVDPSLRMDHVLRDAISGITHQEELDRYMERLANANNGLGSRNESNGENDRNRNKNVLNSNIGNNTFSSLPTNEKYTPRRSDSTGKCVSVGVDTEDLMSMGLFSPGSFISRANNSTYVLQQAISELQLENASLKGSNEHMKGQLHRYKQEVQTLRESLSKSASSASALAEKHRMHSSSVNQHMLEQQNADLLQEIRILNENQKVVEEENRRVVQRCVELEAVAEDATDECEELVARLAEMERELKEVRDERDNLLISHEDYENATTERENENQRLRDEMSWKCQSLEDKCDRLSEAKSALDKEMEVMHTLKAKLDNELETIRKTLDDKNTLISALESQLAQTQDRLMKEEHKVMDFSKEVKALKEEKEHLCEQQEGLRKKQYGVADLEDECSRLRNLNGMIKAKIEITNSELSKVKTQNASLLQQVTSLRSECDAMRIENVALSDNKSDMEMEMRKHEKEYEDQKALISKVEKELGKVITIRDELQKQNSLLRKQLQDGENAKNAAEKTLEELQTENRALRLQMNNYDSVVLKVPESEKRVTNVWQSSPNSHMASPVGVQTPDLSHGNTATPATWLSKSTVSPSEPRPNSDPMDDQLQRIQAAKEKASLILKNISNFRIKQETSSLETEKKKSSLHTTEAFVHSILDSCGKQQVPSI